MVWTACQLTGVPYVNMCTQKEYEAQLVAAGFTVTKSELVEGVLQGFANFIRNHHQKVGKYLLAAEWGRFKNTASILSWLAEKKLIEFYVFVATAPPS